MVTRRIQQEPNSSELQSAMFDSVAYFILLQFKYNSIVVAIGPDVICISTVLVLNVDLHDTRGPARAARTRCIVPPPSVAIKLISA